MTLQDLIAQYGNVKPFTAQSGTTMDGSFDTGKTEYFSPTFGGTAGMYGGFTQNPDGTYRGAIQSNDQGSWIGTYSPDGQLIGEPVWQQNTPGFAAKHGLATVGLLAGAGALSQAGMLGGLGGATAGTTAAPLEAGLANVGSGWAGSTGLGGAAMSAAPLEAGLANVGSTWAGGGGMSSLLSNPNLWLTGAQVVGGLLGADASRDASNAQVQASQAAIDESRRQYDTTRADLAPWRTAGVGALGGLAGLIGLNGSNPVDIMKMDPGYKFAQQQGEQALDRASRARGGFDSGAALKDLLRFNEGLSSQRFNDVYNRYAGVAGTGQNATNTTAGFGAQNAQNVGNLLTGAGNARAAGIVGGANAINQTIGGVTNLWQQNSLLDMLNRRA